MPRTDPLARTDGWRPGRYVTDGDAIHRVDRIDDYTISMTTVYEFADPDRLADETYGPSILLTGIDRYREPTDAEFAAYQAAADADTSPAPGQPTAVDIRSLLSRLEDRTFIDAMAGDDSLDVRRLAASHRAALDLIVELAAATSGLLDQQAMPDDAYAAITDVADDLIVRFRTDR